MGIRVVEMRGSFPQNKEIKESKGFWFLQFIFTRGAECYLTSKNGEIVFIKITGNYKYYFLHSKMFHNI